MSKLLVTGGAGFIGANFVQYWMANHPEDLVVVLDKLTYAGSLQNLKPVRKLANFRFVRGTINNREVVSRLVDEADVVVHFAAESHVDRSIVNPGEFVRTNVDGTGVVLDAVKKFGKRMHHISTDEVFGSLPRNSREKFSEKTPYAPRSPYAASKAASDHLVRAYVNTYKIKATISNCSNNYGPYQHPEKLLPLAITNLMRGKKVPVYGDGGQLRDWLYVEDHCRAIELVLLKGGLGETYCVGGLTDDVTNLEVIRMLLKLMLMGDEMIEFVADRPGHDEKYAVDWKKIKELGWEPKVSLEQGLIKTLEWYRGNEWWWRGKIA